MKLSKRAKPLKIEPKWEKYKEPLWFLPTQKDPPKGFQNSKWVRPVPGVKDPNIPLKPEEGNAIEDITIKLRTIPPIAFSKPAEFLYEGTLVEHPLGDKDWYMPLNKLKDLIAIKSKIPEPYVQDITERIKEQKGLKNYRYDVVEEKSEQNTPYLYLGDDEEGIAFHLENIAKKIGWPTPVEIQEDGFYKVPGYIKDNSGRTVRLSRLLEQATKKLKNDKFNVSKLGSSQKILSAQEFAKYVNDKYSAAPKVTDWELVISAEPSDILMMSTGKGWSSCIKEGGCNFSSLDSAVSQRDMVAYAVVPDAKNWISRVWLRFDGKGNWWPEKKVYGTTALNDSIFLNSVNDYLKIHGILGKTGDYSTEAKGWSDLLSGQIESVEGQKQIIKKLKEQFVPEIPYLDIEKTQRLPKISAPEIIKLIIPDTNADYIVDKIQALSPEIKILKEDNDFLNRLDIITIQIPVELISDLNKIPEIQKIKRTGRKMKIIVKDPNYNKKILNSIIHKIKPIIHKSQDAKILSDKFYKILPDLRIDHKNVLKHFPEFKDVYEYIIEHSGFEFRSLIKDLAQIESSQIEIISSDTVLINIEPEKATPVINILKSNGFLPIIKQALSKRAKDGNYVEKRKEESGNITYVYDEKHVKERNKKKAQKLIKLSKSLKNVRAQVKKDLKHEDVTTRLSAIAVGLLDDTFERVGNRYSAEDMKHYGVTTWLSKHIKFSGSTAKIKYVGKSGIKQDKTVSSPKLVSALKELCKGKSPSDKVFTVDDFTLSDNHVNQYLRPFNITAKDIRGLHANVEVRKQLQKMKKGKDEKERKATFKEAVENAAEIIGHKPSTLKNQYLIPGFEEKYISKGEIIGPKSAAIKLNLIKQASHEGVMLAIMAPQDVKKELKIDKDCLPDFHLTLLYLGKAKDLSELELNAIQKVTKKVCEKHNPIKIEITGAGVFKPEEDGTPVFVIPNGKGLSALQSDLENAISNIIDLPSKYGWVPHMTLSYTDKPELPDFSNLKWTAEKIRFQVGGKKRADIPLGKIKTASYHFQWTKPILEDNTKDLLNASIQTHISYDSLKRAFLHGIQIPLSKSLWHKINPNPISVEQAFQIAKSHSPTLTKDMFESFNNLPAPVVLENSDHSLFLVSGELALAYAKAFHLPPDIFLIKETLFPTPFHLETIPYKK